MKELSVFIDESGDFGEYSSHSPYYIITMIFHNQEDSIEAAVHLERRLPQQHTLESVWILTRECLLT